MGPGVGFIEIGLRRLDREPPALRHRVARVDDEVHENLLDRDGIDPDGRERGRQRGHELDVGADQPPQQLFQLPDDGVDVHDLRLQHLAPAEREQLPRQRRRAFARQPDFLEIGSERVVERDVVEHQVAVAEDRGEQVVEVVGHAAGELANGVHLLRLAQLIFQLATLREVADVDDDRADGTIGEPVDGDAFHDAPRSVRVMESRFSGDDFSRMAQRFDHADAHRLAIVGFEKTEDRSPDHLLGFPSEMPLRRRRRVGDAALAIDEQQSVGAVFDQRAKPFLAPAQRFLRLAALMLLHVERKRMSDRPLQGLDRDVRLAQVVGCAGFHRLDGDFLGAAAREDHDGGVDAPLADFAQQRKAVARAEHVIEQRDVETLRGHDAQRIVVGQGGRGDGVLPCIARAQQLHDHRRIFRRVVNDEDSSRFRHTSTPEHSGDSAAEAAEEAFEHAFRALLQRPAMDRAER